MTAKMRALNFYSFPHSPLNANRPSVAQYSARPRWIRSARWSRSESSSTTIVPMIDPEITPIQCTIITSPICSRPNRPGPRRRRQMRRSLRGPLCGRSWQFSFTFYLRHFPAALDILLLVRVRVVMFAGVRTQRLMPETEINEASRQPRPVLAAPQMAQAPITAYGAEIVRPIPPAA